MEQKEQQKYSSKKVIPVEEGLFTLPETPNERPHLIGSKCKFCGAVFFPKRIICGKCFKDRMKDVSLNHRGRIVTWTVIWMKPSGYKGQVPYVLGEVELPGNVIVRTHIIDVDPNKPKIKIGDDAEIVIKKIYENEEGKDVVCYMFRPV